MNEELFVNAIKKYVADSTVKSIQVMLSMPPGRSPEIQLLQDSIWYNALDAQSKEHVTNIITRAVHDAVFSFMCVLDGVKVIDEQHCEYHLFCINPQDGSSLQLSGIDENENLHEIYNSL